MKRLNKKAFTLVELIIVIAIIAILAVTAFLMLTKWISKSRDSSRLSDINTIDNALQVYLTEKSSLPKPENYTLIYASGTSNIVGYQGDFSDNTAKLLGNLSKAPKDALDNNYYNYYVDNTSTKYQLLGYTEQTSSIGNTANAVDYSSRYVRIAGDKLGILTDANNSPVNKLGLTGIDVALTTGTYKAYFDSTANVSGTGQSLVTMLTLNNKNLASLDTGLVFYSDMETTLNSGGLTMLKDLSSYGNNETCYNSGTAGNCGSVGPTFVNGIKGKAMQFDGIDDFSTGNLQNIFNTGLSFSIWIFKQKDFGTTYQGKYIISNLFQSRFDGSGYGCATLPCISPRNFWIETSQIQISGSNYREPGAFSSTSSLTGQWINIIGTRNTKNIKIYVNGIFKATSVRTGDIRGVANNNLSIGNYLYDIQNGYVGYGFPGIIDEVRVYNRALSDDEVKTIYNAN